MTDYIEREAAIDAISEWLMKALHPENMSSYNEGERAAYRTAISEIAELPAADVRPVVLCRDCVNYVESGEANGEKMCVIDADWCAKIGCYYGFTACTPPYWFCAGGKKREES